MNPDQLMAEEFYNRLRGLMPADMTAFMTTFGSMGTDITALQAQVVALYAALGIETSTRANADAALQALIDAIPRLYIRKATVASGVATFHFTANSSVVYAAVWGR